MKLGIFGCVFLVGSNVSCLGCVLRQAFVAVPGIPLGLALQIGEARLGCIAVTDSGLLEKTVEFQEFIIGWGLGESLGFFASGVELKKNERTNEKRKKIMTIAL